MQKLFASNFEWFALFIVISVSFCTGDNKAVSSSGMVPTLQYDCSHFTESDRDQYDTVGGIIRTGSEAEVHGELMFSIFLDPSYP